MSPRVLLAATESWPSAALYCDGLAVTGCEVFALAPKAAPVHSRPSLSGGSVYRPLAAQASLRTAIRKFAPDLLVSCDERALARTLELYAHEKPHGGAIARLIERSLGVPENYACVQSRLEGLSAMRALGVRIPAMIAVEREADIDRAIASFDFPLVLKADETWGGDGVAIVRSREDAVAAWRKLRGPVWRLRSLVRTFRRRDAHFLLEAAHPKVRRVSAQQFVAGKLAASAFAANAGALTAVFSYDILESHEAGMGPPKLVRRLDCPEMEDAARLVASRFALSGAHGLDFIRDEDGHAHLIEINPRATQGGTLAFGPGRDVPYGLASILMPKPRAARRSRGSEAVEFSPSLTRPKEADAIPREPIVPALEAR
jgi:hypothetical protein